jgi:hypothetical protein
METKVSCCGNIFGYAKVSTIVELSLSVIVNTGLLVGLIYDVYIYNFGLIVQLGILNLICISTNTILNILELKNICRKSIKKWNLVMRIIWTVALGLIVILYLIQLISCTNYGRDYHNYHHSRDYASNYHHSRDYASNYHHNRDYASNYQQSRVYGSNYHHSRDACLIWDRETFDQSDLIFSNDPRAIWRFVGGPGLPNSPPGGARGSLFFSICLLIVGPMFLYGIFKSFLLYKVLKSQSDLPQQLGLPLTRLSQFYGPNSTRTLT